MKTKKDIINKINLGNQTVVIRFKDHGGLITVDCNIAPIFLKPFNVK